MWGRREAECGELLCNKGALQIMEFVRKHPQRLFSGAQAAAAVHNLPRYVHTPLLPLPCPPPTLLYRKR